MDSLREPRRWRLIGAGILLVGVVLRLVSFVSGRSLGIDEAMLALNVVPRSWGELFGQPRYEQIIPPLFLVAEKAAISMFGVSDRSFRLVPVAGAILLLVLVWRLGVRILGARGAALSLAFLVASPMLFRYADEVKPYGLEALAFAGLILLALRLRDAPGPTRWLALLGLGFLALAGSLSAYFVAPGVVAGLLAAPEVRREGRQRWWLAGLAVAWAIAGLLLYIGYYGPRGDNPYFARYWAGAFPVPGLVGTLHSLGGFGLEFLGRLLHSENASPFALELPLALLAAGGFASLLLCRKWTIAALFGVPILTACTAAAVHRYPMSARLWLFLAPGVVLMVAGGIEWTVRALPVRRRSLAAGSLVVASALVSLPEIVAKLSSREALDSAPMKSAVRVWKANVRPGDATYVGDRSIPAWIFYSTDWGRPEPARLKWLLRESQALGPNAGNIPSRGRPVEQEGDSLVWRGVRGPELLAIPSGAEATMYRVALVPPDQGWPENEARRMLAASRECLWVVFASGPAAHRALLRTAVERSGGRVVTIWRQGRGAVWSVRTPTASRMCASHP